MRRFSLVDSLIDIWRYSQHILDNKPLPPNYVGEVIEFACKPPRFAILLEEPYYIGSNKFHGVDWVVSDDTGHLFIEAKTKRLTLSAKILSTGSALECDLITIATAILQHYQNIRRALDGKTSWQPDGQPIYPMILTLED
jgi:hypothetical protein